MHVSALLHIESSCEVDHVIKYMIKSIFVCIADLLGVICSHEQRMTLILLIGLQYKATQIENSWLGLQVLKFAKIREFYEIFKISKNS